nr:MAG TPA: DNA-specific endonuclease I [Caudoviricetes sp.]
MHKIILTLVLSLVPALALAAGNTTNDSFSQAKRMLERQVYHDHRVTIYCSAEFNAQKRVTLPAGFTTPAHEKRATKIEWEHAVPAENFGRAFPEWRDGHPECVNRNGKPFKGRRCAEKVNMEYRHMQADMYNLFPAIGAVNAVRSNKQYSALPSSASAFGSCPAKVDGNRFEPPDRAKGQVARAALYMADSYPKYRLSRQQQQLFEVWDKMFPVDAWECTRAKRIEKLQGNANARVKQPCQQAGLW